MDGVATSLPVRHAELLRFVARSGLMALIFFLNSGFVILASRYSAGVAAIWSANAILVFALMIAPRRDHLAYGTGAFVASLAVNFWAHYGAMTALSYSIANILEAALVAWAMSGRSERRRPFIAPENLVRFGVAALTVPLISAAVAAAPSQAHIWHEWVSWYLSDTLGLLFVVPSLQVIRTTLSERNPKRLAASRIAEFAAIFALVAAAALGIFLQSVLPLLFAIALPLLVAVFRCGAIGGVIATGIVAIISITATVFGFGPIAIWSTDAVYQTFLLQAFLVCQLLISLPVAAVLADVHDKAAKLIEQERDMRRLAEGARRAAEVSARKSALMIATDELTGLASRRRILRKLDHLVARAVHSGEPLAIALFDVDNFKLINDRFGHGIGDEVLRLIGRITVAKMPCRCAVGRVGGEEFLMILPGQTSAQAGKHAERLRIAIMNGTNLSTKTAATISIGVASLSDGKSLETLMQAADAALYAAKAAGRNRIRQAA
jgi:diguanylate cyclase